MQNKYKYPVKLILGLVTAHLILFFALLLGGPWHAALVSAQEPSGDSGPPVVDQAALTALGLSAAEVQSALATVADLQIIKTTGTTSVNSGSTVAYTIRITNTHATESAVVFFYDNYPSQLQNVTFAFTRPATETTIFNNPKPTWVLQDPLPANEVVQITVSGKLVSASNATVVNTASAIDLFGASKSNSVSVNIVGSGPAPGGSGLIFLPFVLKPEPVVLAYSEQFNSGNPWAEFDSNGCRTDHQTGQYWVDVDLSNRDCLPPAKNENKPESPYRTYGEFEMAAYISGEDQNEDNYYGLFINGSGGDDYYVFRIQPNEDGCSSGGDWELRRRKDDSESTIANGSCHPSIKRGYGSGATNILKIAHTNDRKLSMYINNTLVGSVTEPNSSSHLTGTGTGLFVRSGSKDALVKVDYFNVYKINN